MKRLSDFQRAARQRWPQHYKQHGGVVGDGCFAVLSCTFFDPSAGYKCHGEVNLFATRAEAEKFAIALDRQIPYPGRIADCSARTRGLCKGKHEVISLAEN